MTMLHAHLFTKPSASRRLSQAPTGLVQRAPSFSLDSGVRRNDECLFFRAVVSDYPCAVVSDDPYAVVPVDPGNR